MRRLVIPVGLLLSVASPAWAQKLPNLDYRKTCAGTPEVGMDRKSTIASCLRDEAQAKSQLPPFWSKASQRARNDCVAETTQGGLPSYVELLVCLQGTLLTKTR